jgi:hypothetical protein
MEKSLFPKSIRLFLIDGMPNGRVFAELSNWIGKVYKLPRTMIAPSEDRIDLAGTGVYLLFGKDPDDDSRDMVYIGESEEVYKRLRSHLDGKEFWNYAVVIISKDDNLNKAHLKYLESKMYDRASEAKRYQINNINSPTCSAISEPDVAEMEEFFSNLVLLVSTLGFKVFDKLKQAPSEPKDEIIFHLSSARGANARGQQTTEGFVVYEGSAAAKDVVDSFKGVRFRGTYNLRLKLIDDEVIKKEREELIFTQDYLFSSPSAAAMAILGRSANGRTEWKTSEGKMLKDVEKDE